MNKQHSYYKKSLSLLKKTNPKLVYQVSTIDPQNLEFCQTLQGELNLKRDYQGQTYYYHSQQGALDEAISWFDSLDHQHATVLYIYGIGLGYYYEAAKSWLKNHSQHALVFLEEDLGVLYRLFETEKGLEILKNPQVHILYSKNLLTDKTLFNELSWTYISCPFTVSCLKLYADVNQDGFLQLHHRLSHDAVQKKVLVDEYLQYGITFFRNFYPNLLELPHAYLGNRLFGQFKNIPAIICGAGPSLKKNLDILKTLTDKAFIFAGGSALNALTSKGITPHFGAGIDPNQGQYERILTSKSPPIPFFYRNRLFHEALKIISGPKLYLTGSGGYEIANWFEERLGIEGECLDEGHNIVNFCIEIAHALGCNPIILVGVDLAFTDQQLYADGVITHSHLLPETIQENIDFDSQPIEKADIYGQPVYTLWKWITESEWTSEFAKNHLDITMINATEGGIGFVDIPNQTLSEVAENYLQPSINLTSLIQEKIDLYPLSHCTKQKVIELIIDLQQSLERCLNHIDTLLQEMQQITSNIKNKASYPVSFQTPKAALAEINIEEEAGYQYILDIFNLIYIRLHHRKIQDLQSSRRRLSAKKRDLEKIDLHIQRLHFLRNVALVNIELMNRTLRNENLSSYKE